MKIASRFKIEDSRYIAGKVFHLDDPEGMAVWYIFKMAELKAKNPASAKEIEENAKTQQEILDNYPKNLKQIRKFDAKDGATLIMYALEKKQYEFVKFVADYFKDKVLDLRFELPAMDLTQKDAQASQLQQLPDSRSSNNTLLQALASFGKLDLLPELGISKETIEAMKNVKPKPFQPTSKLSAKYKLENGRCIVEAFDLSSKEGMLFHDIHRGDFDGFKTDLSHIKDLSVNDYEALTLYSLNKGQDAILSHLVQQMGDKVADMKFILPVRNQTQIKSKVQHMPSFVNHYSTNNNFLQVLADYNKLDLLPQMGISNEAVARMQTSRYQIQKTTLPAAKFPMKGRSGHSL